MDHTNLLTKALAAAASSLVDWQTLAIEIVAVTELLVSAGKPFYVIDSVGNPITVGDTVTSSHGRAFEIRRITCSPTETALHGRYVATGGYVSTNTTMTELVK